MSVELVDADKQLPIAFRNTIANMMAEAEALNGIFAPDEITAAWYRAKGITELPYPPFTCGRCAIRDR
jgi:aconitase A